ncbi:MULTISPECIES: hypothetical protein [Streptomyces]|uniref:hypothetical protein n=1 Tax=Streptomyces TaxID=1883 RepID=UPI001677B559|nr:MULTISPECIES: hypothetical protein [Streptomyces]MBK3520538.1 hypothetical protein [Streptomyces sp. MBT70]
MTRASAAAVALALSVLAPSGTASADPNGHPQPGTYCTGWESVYGQGGYNFTDFRVCVQVADNEGRSAMYIETDRNTYWSSGAWYNATEGYPAKVSATVNMGANDSTGGPSVSEYGSWTQTSRHAELPIGPIGIVNCGIRHLDVSYYQVNPYLGPDYAIDVKRSYDDFVLDC